MESAMDRVYQQEEPSNGICPVLAKEFVGAGYVVTAYCPDNCTVQQVSRLERVGIAIGSRCINPTVVGEDPLVDASDADPS